MTDNKKGTDAAHYITASVHCMHISTDSAELSIYEGGLR